MKPVAEIIPSKVNLVQRKRLTNQALIHFRYLASLNDHLYCFAKCPLLKCLFYRYNLILEFYSFKVPTLLADMPIFWDLLSDILKAATLQIIEILKCSYMRGRCSSLLLLLLLLFLTVQNIASLNTVFVLLFYYNNCTYFSTYVIIMLLVFPSARGEERWLKLLTLCSRLVFQTN